MTGASLRELMGRMGHSITRAALIYQHHTTERDRLIAAMMSEIIEAELADPDNHRARSTPRPRWFLTPDVPTVITALTWDFDRSG